MGRYRTRACAAGRQEFESKPKWRVAVSNMKGLLIFWLVFWPGFLMVLLLNQVAVHYHIIETRFLMLGGGIYIALCGGGLMLSLRKFLKDVPVASKVFVP
jgi:hypothetical protein